VQYVAEKSEHVLPACYWERSEGEVGNFNVFARIEEPVAKVSPGNSPGDNALIPREIPRNYAYM